MSNYIHPGHTLKVLAPYEVNKGDFVQVGALFGAAKSWASKGELVEILTAGVFEVSKSAEQVWNIGERVYWNVQERKITTIGSGSFFVGIVVEPEAGQSEKLGRIKIFGIAQ